MTADALYKSFSRIPLEFERGDGCWLETRSGERYLDFAGGIAVNSLGHSHPHLVKALTEQAQKLWHVSNLYQVPGQARLAERLVENSFADRVFFTNSGAEALECAIKTARRYQFVNGHPEKYRIITFEGAFHGRTLATIAAGGQKKYLEGFGPVVEGFDQVPFGDVAAARAAITPETAAILIEPLQGEGGIRELPAGALAACASFATKTACLLILDEVQCGIGRTGKLFAYQWTDVEPDIVAIAKGIGGGFPVGACLATEAAAAGMTPGTHGTTFGGNPLAMAVGNAVLDVVLADGFLDRRQTQGTAVEAGAGQCRRCLSGCDRGRARLWPDGGIKCKMPNGDVNAAVRAEHLLLVPAGDNVLRLLPPLIVSDDEIRIGVERIRAAAATLSTAAQSAA
jgi:acetylornithine/N-succinyldiaminopimelate aminotransferase